MELRSIKNKQTKAQTKRKYRKDIYYVQTMKHDLIYSEALKHFQCQRIIYDKIELTRNQ